MSENNELEYSMEQDLKKEMEELTPTAPNADGLYEAVKKELNEDQEEDSEENVSEEDKLEEENSDDETEEEKNDSSEEDKEEAKEDKESEDESDDETQEELILGKFKSRKDLEDAYTNLQKAFSQKQKPTEEEKKVFESDVEFEQKINDVAGNAMLPIVEKALNGIQDADQQKDAIFAWNKYKTTGDMKFFEEARGFLSNIQDRNLQVDLMNKRAEVAQDFNSRRDEIELEPLKQQLIELEEEDPEWMADETHQQIIADAIKINRKVDVKQIKALINTIGSKAVEKFQRAEAAKKAKEDEKKPNVSLKTSNRTDPPVKPKDFSEMTIEEQLLAEYSKK